MTRPPRYYICRACGEEMLASGIGEVGFWLSIGYVVEVFKWDKAANDYTFHHSLYPDTKES